LRRRGLGAFATKPADPNRALAALARAGFSHDVATAALALSLEAAEAVLARLRQS